MEISANEIIRENNASAYEKYIFRSRLSKNEYLIKDRECKNEWILKTDRKCMVRGSRRDVARHIAERSNLTTDQAEEVIEMDGCVAINEMNIGYKYAYLLHDVWLIYKN